MTSSKIKNISLLLVLLLGLLILVCLIDNGGTRQYATVVDGKRYRIVVNNELGYHIKPDSNNENRFVIYKNDIPIINTGFITEGIETDALTVILKTDEPEYEIMKGGAMFYAYEQYNSDGKAHTIVIRHQYRPAYIVCTMIGSIEDAVTLCDAITVK